MKVSILTMGCDKNTVDSERYLAEMVDRGATVAESAEDADVILINTCGFIDAAKKESIDAIVEAGRLKTKGSARAVVAVGCMVERHKGELESALPEVDLFLGSSEMDRLIPELADRGLIDDVPVTHPGVRLFSGDARHVRYLKVSEGCDHGCAFCAIPLMRGRHRSFTRDDLIREAQLLEAQGAREVNLVAQDLAHYGRDLRGQGEALQTLLESLVAETGVPWYRMLYIYSAGITPKLLEFVARESRVVPYFDMPMQHGSDEVLKRMRRPERNKTIRETAARIRDVVPDVAIRTTCIVGFPGETDADFETLLALLQDVQFDRVGAFTYSAQQGTAAGEMGDDVPASLKQERMDRLMELQLLLTQERFEARVGKTVRAIVDRELPDGSLEGRTIWQAPEIDGITIIGKSIAEIGNRKSAIAPGAFLEVQIESVVDDYDLNASLVRVECSAPPSGSRVTGHRSRQLPLASIGSFGR
ncbi:MAG: 30S ribosomal protein S12 methylthiotransferase RimO [Gemmatimonadota bacterium]